MKKTWLSLIILFITQSAMAAFPKPTITDSAQSSVAVAQPVFRPLGEMSLEEFEHLSGKKLSLPRKIGFKLMHRALRKEAKDKGTPDWIVWGGGFLLGFLLGPVGFGIVYLSSKNKSFRMGAVYGLGTFLGLLLLYLFLVIFVVVLFYSLGLY